MSSLRRRFGFGAASRVTIAGGTLVSERDGRDSYYRALAREAFPGKRILILEDNEDCREILSNFLTRWGMKVDAIASCAAARSALEKAERYDFAVIDFSLPDGTGDEIARQCRNAARHNGIGLISLSGNRCYADAALYDITLQKPLSPNRLREALAETILQSQARMRHAEVVSGNC